MLLTFIAMLVDHLVAFGKLAIATHVLKACGAFGTSFHSGFEQVYDQLSTRSFESIKVLAAAIIAWWLTAAL